MIFIMLGCCCAGAQAFMPCRFADRPARSSFINKFSASRRFYLPVLVVHPLAILLAASFLPCTYLVIPSYRSSDGAFSRARTLGFDGRSLMVESLVPHSAFTQLLGITSQ